LESSDDDDLNILRGRPPNVRPQHPSKQRILLLWQLFVDNINPMTKIVHVPTLDLAIRKATNAVSQVPAGFEALMFAIYTLAVSSLNEDECQSLFQGSKRSLFRSYLADTAKALARAKFMSTSSTVIVQALVLHVLAVRNVYDARKVWNLTGLVVRIAEGMGLGIDGELLRLSPFEAEVRRRIWWQIKMHEFRAAELAGQPKFSVFSLTSTTPKPPANVDDSELYPDMTAAPLPSSKPTEMLWIQLRSELAVFAYHQTSKVRQQGAGQPTSEEFTAMDDLALKDKWIESLEDALETKFLRYCDPSKPLHYLTLVGGRMSLCLIRFVAHHPRRWTKLSHIPLSERKLVWSIALQLLEYYNILQTNSTIQCFAWSIPYFVQWHALLHVLDTLRVDPQHSESLKAWKLIDALYQNNWGLLTGLSSPLSAVIASVCLKAYGARKDSLAGDGLADIITPEYITKL
jgi:hypothetical protein